MKKALILMFLAMFILLNGCAKPNSDEMAGQICCLRIEDFERPKFTDETKVRSTVKVTDFFENDYEMTYVDSTNYGTHVRDNYAYKKVSCSYAGSVLCSYSRIGMEFPESYEPRTEKISFEEAEAIVREEFKDILQEENFVLQHEFPVGSGYDLSYTGDYMHYFTFFSVIDGGIIVDILDVWTDLCGNLIQFSCRVGDSPLDVLDTIDIPADIPDDFDNVLIEKAKEYIASHPDETYSRNLEITNGNL